MGKVFFYILLTLLILTVAGFVLGFQNFAYIVGFIFAAFALGVGFMHSSKNDRYNANFLKINDKKKEK
ncbi:MAG TPA: hypothetical protein VJ546_05165 [Bacillales bacterium]|nr:hypothetical protein [Bacillales bacterium]